VPAVAVVIIACMGASPAISHLLFYTFAPSSCECWRGCALVDPYCKGMDPLPLAGWLAIYRYSCEDEKEKHTLIYERRGCREMWMLFDLTLRKNSASARSVLLESNSTHTHFLYSHTVRLRRVKSQIRSAKTSSPVSN
jgi:hypothetical protein